MNTCDAAIDSRCWRAAPDRSKPWIGCILALLKRRHEQARLRRELAGMPDQLLKDMRVTREDLHREYRKTFRRS